MTVPNRRVAVLAGILLLSGAGCARDRGPIRLGWAGGPLSDSTVAPSLHTARLAVGEINASGGVRGRLLELVALDDYGEPDSAIRVAAALRDSGVIAVIGHTYSSTTLAAAPVYNNPADPLLEVSPSATSPEISRAGDYTFRICPSDERYGAALADWAWQHLHLTRGVVFYVNDSYGRGIRRTFSREFRRQGGEVTDLEPFLESRPEVGPYVDRLARQGNAQFIVLAGNVTAGAEVLRQIRARGITLPVLGGDGLDGIEAAGPVAAGVYLTTVYLPTLTTEENTRFLEAYRAAFPLGGAVDYSAAATYDLVYLLRTALERAAPGRRGLRDAVAATGQSAPAYAGVTGTIAFDALGDVPDLHIRIGVVRNGTLRPAEER
ncbi:MAG: branched-chain amino acid ABC transporter substrate-binding protein [Gemmatimonadales bacterium]